VALIALVAFGGSAAASAATGWRAPLEGRLRVLRAFAPPPVSSPWLPGNRGVDLAAPVGASVLAAGAGIVTFAGPLAGRGVVVVDHGVLRTTYEPVDASVRVGERVEGGAVLGRLEPSGVRCTAVPCLHWGLLRGRRYLDPMSLLGGRVRLLPMLGGSDARLAPAFGPVAARGSAPPRQGSTASEQRTPGVTPPVPAPALAAGLAVLVGTGGGALGGRRIRGGG
jgi:hypothetical protein